MTDLNPDTLKQSLTGVWESPVMILEFYADEGNPTGTGKVIATGNGHAIDFTYKIVRDEEKIFLSLTTPMTGAMEYEVGDWSPDRLKLIKKGYTSEVDFVKK